MNIMKKKYIIVLVILFSISACKKQLDTNLSNPNGVTSAQITAKDVFANAVQTTSSTITTAYSFANEWMGIWARTTTYSASSGTEVEDFKLQNSFSYIVASSDGLWASQYHNIRDYNFIISNSAKGSILPGAAMIMKAMVFQDLVDVYGDVPYTQASNPDLSTQPKYDDAASIYKNLISDIDAGIASVKASTSTSDDVADKMFGGNKSKWVRFANTLKLKILLRQVPNGDQTFVKSAIANILSEGSGFLGVGEDAKFNPGYADAAGGQSPFWSVYGFQVGGKGNQLGQSFYIANQTMMDNLSTTNDPRIAYLYDTTNGKHNSVYLGTVNTTLAPASMATIGPGLLHSPSDSAVLMLASQSFFLQAEAAERGLISGNYSALLKTAIEESFRFLNIPNAISAADNFYTSSTDSRVNPANSADPIKTIIYQKWVALAGVDGLETWAEYRRTGYPDRTNPTVLSGVSAADNVLPKKLLYPQSEYNLNKTNVGAENQTSTGFKTKIFWGL